MGQLEASMTLAEAVDAFPQLAREFEKSGLGLLLRGWPHNRRVVHSDRSRSVGDDCRAVCAVSERPSPPSGPR